MKLASAILIGASLVGTAAAQPQPAPFPFRSAAPPPPSHSVAVTVSPVHLIFPIAEVTAELKLVPHMGIGVTLGAGRISNADKSVTGSAYEAGGQFNYYILDAFEGLHVGGEILFLKINDVDQDLTATADGLTMGPYIGFKVDTDIGFTFVGQAGAAFAAYRAEANNSTNTASDKKVYPLLNLNVGWSF